MSTTQDSAPFQPFDTFQIRTITFADVKASFADGARDFMRKPLLSLFFGVIFAAFGLIFVSGLLVYDQIWMIVPAGVGFPLVAPFLANGVEPFVGCWNPFDHGSEGFLAILVIRTFFPKFSCFYKATKALIILRHTWRNTLIK